MRMTRAPVFVALLVLAAVVAVRSSAQTAPPAPTLEPLRSIVEQPSPQPAYTTLELRHFAVDTFDAIEILSYTPMTKNPEVATVASAFNVSPRVTLRSTARGPSPSTSADAGSNSSNRLTSTDASPTVRPRRE
jgi:hypothetical protein